MDYLPSLNRKDFHFALLYTDTAEGKSDPKYLRSFFRLQADIHVSHTIDYCKDKEAETFLQLEYLAN